MREKGKLNLGVNRVKKKHKKTENEKLYKHRKIRAWVIIISLTFLAILFSEFKPIKILAISPLIIAVILGAVFGNSAFKVTNLLKKTNVMSVATKQILRLGIILYGFRITFGDIAVVGMGGIMMAFLIVFSTFFIGYFVGGLLGLDKKSSILISCGSSICGAAAVLATESIVKGGSQRVAVAVCTVVVYGTIGMFMYPLLYRSGFFNLDASQMGFLMGATLHEVAHAVAAGSAISVEAEGFSVIVKMLRVLMLVPFLLMMGTAGKFLVQSEKRVHKNIKNSIPYFAIWFLVAVAVGSLFPVDFRAMVLPYINFVDTFLLSIAMVALGFGIRKDVLLNAGKKPFILAAILVVWLVGFGYAATLILS